MAAPTRSCARSSDGWRACEARSAAQGLRDIRPLHARARGAARAASARSSRRSCCRTRRSGRVTRPSPRRSSSASVTRFLRDEVPRGRWVVRAPTSSPTRSSPKSSPRCGSGGVSASLGAHKDLATLYVYNFGNAEQHERWLDPGHRGRHRRRAWRSPSPTPDRMSPGSRPARRRDGDDWVINGSKIFITNGAWADFVVVAAKTDPDAGHGGHHAVRRRCRHPGLRGPADADARMALRPDR